MSTPIVIGVHVNGPQNEINTVRNMYSFIERLPTVDQERLRIDLNRILEATNSKDSNSIPQKIKNDNYKEIFNKINKVARDKGITVPKELVSDISKGINKLEAEEAVESPQANEDVVAIPDGEKERKQRADNTNPQENNVTTVKIQQESPKKTLFDKVTAVLGVGLPLGGLLYQYLRDEKQKKDTKEEMNKFNEEINKLRSGEQTDENKNKLDDLLKEKSHFIQNNLLNEAMNLTKKHFKQIEQQKRAVSNQSGLNLSNLAQLFSGNAARDPRYNQSDLQHLLNLQSHRLNKII
jgi:hypothetical protein